MLKIHVIYGVFLMQMRSSHCEPKLILHTIQISDIIILSPESEKRAGLISQNRSRSAKNSETGRKVLDAFGTGGTGM